LVGLGLAAEGRQGLLTLIVELVGAGGVAAPRG